MSVPGAASPLFLATTGAAEFSIARSLRFNSADTAYLNRTPSSAGNRKTFTFSTWLKRCATGADHRLFESSADTANQTTIKTIGDALQVFDRQSNNIKINLQTSRVFRDLSAWYHIAVSIDTSQSTESDRVKIYVNGAQETLFSTATYPAQNQDLYLNQTNQHDIGRFKPSNNQYLDGLLAEVNFCDGTAYDASSFGAFDDNGVWQAIDTAGLTFGTNGFRLKFADNSGATATTLGKDTSGNSNNWTPNNLSVAAGAGNDSLVDTPMNAAEPTDSGIGGEIAGNYATWNPLNASGTLSDGNLKGVTSTSGTRSLATNIGISSGKYYLEIACSSVYVGSFGANLSIGVNHSAFPTSSSSRNYSSSDSVTYYANGEKYVNGSNSSYGASYTSGDIIGIAIDLDNNQVTFYKNGTSQGVISKTFSGSYVITVTEGDSSGTSTVILNAGQRPFTHNAPTGFKCLNTASLPPPTIADGSKYFDIKLYTGNDGTQTISGFSFAPDWVWIKSRSSGAAHCSADIVVGANKHLLPNETAAEATGLVPAFTSDGFTVNNLRNGADNGTTNDNNLSYVSWAWDGGTSTVTNNNGSIASQVRAQPSAGFSIVGYNSGSSAGNYSVGHGLNTAPTLIIHKTRSTGNWWVYHASVIDNLAKYLQLNSNAGVATNSANMWGGAFPTNSVFGVRVGDLIGTSQDAIAYCFAPVKGYSAIGSFSPNGTTDNAFVYTGFRTRFILAKFTTPGDWMLLDTSRRPNGPTGGTLIAQDSAAEDGVYSNSQVGFDFLSNGFKVRHNGAPMGDSGKTVIYYAVAENPFQANGGLAR